MAVEHNRGVYNAIVDETKCVYCGACIDVCFGAAIEHHEPKESLQRLIQKGRGMEVARYGYATDSNLRFRASSGGAVTALLTHLLDEGHIDAAIVVKLASTDPALGVSLIAESKEAIQEAMGSKYCPVRISTALKQMKTGAKYAFVGLPCQIYATRKLQEKGRLNGEISIYIGLFCGGTLSYHGTRYILRQNDVEFSNIQAIGYRGFGWPGRFYAETKDDVISLPFVTYWPNIARWFYLDRCLTCLSGLNLNADVSFGDFFSREHISTDPLGTSVMLVMSGIGAEALSSTENAGHLHLKYTSIKKVIESQSSMFLKHRRYPTRLLILKLLRMGRPSKGRYESKLGFRIRDALDELLLHSGRALASRPGLWPFFDVFKSLMTVYSRIVMIIGKIIVRNSSLNL